VAKKSDTADNIRDGLHKSLERLAKRLPESKSLKAGDIVFKLAGPGGATLTFAIQSSQSQARVVASDVSATDRPPLIEVIGDAETIQAIIDGKKDARRQFLAGGIRIRGDLLYLSDMALELGLLKEPL
jgi:hypothetical protein